MIPLPSINNNTVHHRLYTSTMVFLQPYKLGVANANANNNLPDRKSLQQILFFLHTLYLFTANDFLTFAIPTTLFGLFGALSGPILSTNSSPAILPIVFRVPRTLLITWLNLLIFTVSNQSNPAGLAQDRINHPHRPIPSGRITAAAARDLLLVVVPTVCAAGWLLCIWQETLLLLVAEWMYNDLNGSDAHFLLRNGLNSLGYTLYSGIALRVMVGREYTLKTEGIHWLFIVGLVMSFTQYICDVKDLQGDRATGGRRCPLCWEMAWRGGVLLLLSCCSLLFVPGSLSWECGVICSRWVLGHQWRCIRFCSRT